MSVQFKNYGLIGSTEEFTSYVDRLIEQALDVGFDIETGYHGAPREEASLHPETAFLVGFSFTNSTEWARYVALGHDAAENLDVLPVARDLWRLLTNCRVVAHNAKFELRHLAVFFRKWLWDDPVHGPAVQASDGYWDVHADSMVEAYLVAELKSFGLKPTTFTLFGHSMRELHELFPDLPKNKRKTLRFNTLPLSPEVVAYACEDALWSLAIHQLYHPRVKDMFLYRVEMAVIPVLCEMEDFGVLYDWAYMAEGAREGADFMAKLNAEIQVDLSQAVGEPVMVNLGSSQQLSKILYERMGLSTTRMTKGSKDKPGEKKMSTDKIALGGLAKDHPTVRKIVWWKGIKKLVGTYLEKYQGRYDYAPDGRAHPNHMQTAVITGRFAVDGPPYQQTPKKYFYELDSGDVFEFRFREAIIAPPEHYILGFDLGQAELRAIAGEAKEEALLRAFANNEDVHSRTAALMLGIPIEEVTEEIRAIGKTFNFAIVYGMSVQGLAERLACSVTEAQQLFDQYFMAYPALAGYFEAQKEFGRRHGYVMSRFGRRLPIWEFESDQRWIREKGERACVNYPIQGAATGDYMKIAMVRVRKAIQDAGLADRVHLVMNVHDALEFYVHRSVDPQLVINVLQPAVIFDVQGWPTLVADWHIGTSWGRKKELELSADGTIRIKGSAPEPEPVTDDPEAVGEDVVDLPSVSAEALASVLGGVAPSGEEVGEPDSVPDADRSVHAVLSGGDGVPRNVVVQLTDLPTEEEYLAFMDLASSSPGPNTVILRTAHGEVVLDIPGGTTLCPADQPAVAIVVPGAQVFWDAADVPVGAIVGGLAL